MKEFIKKLIERLEERTAFLSDCTKYGNKNAKQQEKSYSTMMMYEVADLVEDLIEIVNQLAEEYKEKYSKDYGWRESRKYIQEHYFNRIIELSKKYDYPCENIALDFNWVFGLIDKIENQLAKDTYVQTIDVAELVNAENGNDGWIPVSSGRLPEEKENPITKNYYVYPVMVQFDDVTDIRYYSFGNGHWHHGPQIMDKYVTHWLDIKPYQPKGE